ncbi:MAG: hypothetical protein LBQ52_00790 [Helicobacteraceae bacterium]|jgi:hypothetical protein|nr:hypothetical protein [Helicobacteraceae bacterium]
MSSLFLSDSRQYIEQKVLSLLNNVDLMNKNTLNSPRAVGDAIQSFLEERLHYCFPENSMINYGGSFARRSMADYAFEDKEGYYYVIDFKTHSLATKFNMPNITSVERLARFYKDFRNYFVILMVSYTIEKNRLSFQKCLFAPIESFDWSCLTLGALGWGQVQIANANNIVIKDTITRKQWMLSLCDELDVFYPNEITKITDRIDYFKKIRTFWEHQ